MTLPEQTGYSEDMDPLQFEELAASTETKVRRALARNPLTPAEVLESLSHDSDNSVRLAIAGNPNAPAEVLMRLGAQFPEQLLENPALDVLVIENPDLFTSMPEATLAAIAKRETCPLSVLEYLARAGRGKGLLMSLIQNGRTPSDAIRMLIDEDMWSLGERFDTTVDAIRAIKGLAVHHVGYRGEVNPEQARSALWQAIVDRLPGGEMISDLLFACDVPDQIKDEITAWTCLHMGASAAKYPISRPASVLETAAWKADRRRLKIIQEESNCPLWLRDVSTTLEARKAIEDNASGSKSLWMEATASGCDAMLLILADHPFMGKSIDVSRTLHRMAQALHDKNWTTLDGKVLEREIWFIASHINTNPETLDFMYKSTKRSNELALPDQFTSIKDSELQKSIQKWLKTSRCSPTNIRSVAGIFWATDHQIRDHGKAPFDLIVELEAAFHIRAAVASNPRTPSHVVHELAAYGEPEIALNPSADADALMKVYRVNPNYQTIMNLAQNPTTPIDVLIKISNIKDEGGNYSRRLSKNASCPEEVLLQLANMKNACSSWPQRDAIRDLMIHPNQSGRVLDVAVAASRLGDLIEFGKVLAGDTRLSTHSYERLAKLSGSHETRRILAGNPAITMDLLNRLAMDRNESVKEAATRMLKQRQEGATQ